MTTNGGATLGDYGRQFANLAGVAAQIAISAYVVLAGTDAFSNAAPGGDPPIIPARYAFAIWTPIYAGCLGYAIYQAFPSDANRALLRRAGWWTASAFAATSAWLIAAQRVERIWLTVALLGAIVASLTMAAHVLSSEKALSRMDEYLIALPIDLFFGWTSVALFANTAAALRYAGVTSAGHETFASLVMLALATVGTGGVIVTLHRSAAYVGAVLWALVSIAVANGSGETRPPNLTVSLAAAASAVILLACAWRMRTARGR